MGALIKQRNASDCAICCIAMATGKAYEEVLEAAGEDFDPERGLRSEHAVLTRLGLSYGFEKGEPVGDFVSYHRGLLSAEFFRNFAWGRGALVTVPSLNIQGGWHMVFWDGHHVLDPSEGKTYSEFGQLMPDELVLFRERPAPG